MFKPTDLECRCWDSRSGLANQCLISPSSLPLAFIGPEFKASPAIFASTDLLSCWFKRIKNPKVITDKTQGYHWFCTFTGVLGLKWTVETSQCFWKGAGPASALFRVAASATSIPSPLKPWHKCKGCWSKGHAGGDVLCSAVGEKVKDAERNDCQQPLYISWRAEQLSSYNLPAHTNNVQTSINQLATWSCLFISEYTTYPSLLS